MSGKNTCRSPGHVVATFDLWAVAVAEHLLKVLAALEVRVLLLDAAAGNVPIGDDKNPKTLAELKTEGDLPTLSNEDW